jgi:hypothetical protein
MEGLNKANTVFHAEKGCIFKPTYEGVVRINRGGRAIQLFQ